MTEKKRQAFQTAINLLKFIYESDFTVVAQIITAEATNDTELIADYMQCVVDGCSEIVEILKEK